VNEILHKNLHRLAVKIRRDRFAEYTGGEIFNLPRSALVIDHFSITSPRIKEINGYYIF
jgi:hypothetical protein